MLWNRLSDLNANWINPLRIQFSENALTFGSDLFPPNIAEENEFFIIGLDFIEFGEESWNLKLEMERESIFSQSKNMVFRLN